MSKKILNSIKALTILIISLICVVIQAASIYFSFQEMVSVIMNTFTADLLVKAIALLVFHSMIFIITVTILLAYLTRPIRSPLVGKSRLPINRRRK